MISCISRNVGARRLGIYKRLFFAGFPGPIIVHVEDMLLLNRVTNVYNLLLSSLILTQRSPSCPAATVRFVVGPQQQLMQYSPCTKACVPPSSQLRIPLPWICHLCLFEWLVMLTTLRFPRSHRILRSWPSCITNIPLYIATVSVDVTKGKGHVISPVSKVEVLVRTTRGESV